VNRRVAVVGAGPSGLATVKELLAEGHDPVCLERAASLGGVFRFGERDGVIWESCRLTSSGPLTAFSDFPVGPGQDGHLTARDYVAYLERYVAAFGLAPRLRFGSTVERVERAPEGGWRVRWRDPEGAREERFDAVAIASGLHQHPLRPDFAGLDGFAGEVMHASEYRRPAQVAGRRVLVVGAGESGADLAAEVAEHAAECVLSLRRGVSVLARIRFGAPNDYRTSRLTNCPADWIHQTRHPVDDGRRRAYRWLFLPVVVLDKALQLVTRWFWELAPLVRPGSWSETRANFATRKLTKRLLVESGGMPVEQFGTKSDEFVRAIVAGRCRRVGAIERFDGRRVRFAGGAEQEPDLVVLCTGFETRIPFLEAAVADAPRFLHTFHPAIGRDLGFVGFLRPAFGAIPPLAELQARWFARLQSGLAALPPEAEMERAIVEETERRARIFRAVRGRLAHLVDHTSFCDALAEQVGCKPGTADVARESRRFRRRFWAGPFVAAQYRLVGPHARPEIARASPTPGRSGSRSGCAGRRAASLPAGSARAGRPSSGSAPPERRGPALRPGSRPNFPAARPYSS
jgi:dimethylaniline monooxygenase (N-oxide forming)